LKSDLIEVEISRARVDGEGAALRRGGRCATICPMLEIARHFELLDPAETREADRLAIAAGIAGINLMERAGRAVADKAVLMSPSAGRIAVVCGPGANGGDGFIAARILAERGYRVAVGLLGRREQLKGDAGEAARRYDGPAAPALAMDLDKPDLVVDALFGAGLDRDLEGEPRAIVEKINDFARRGGRPVLAVDLPSGLDGATGKPRGVAVEASASVTFFRLKPGHLLLPGRELSGEIVLADIGIPAGVLARIQPKAFANAPALWRSALPRLGAEGHKYSRGHAVVVSGNGSHTGAARLAARAALRVGSGLVTLASPPSALAINAAHATAVMVAPFEGAQGLAALLADHRRNVVILGPGAGVGEATAALVEVALKAQGHGEERRSAVLDADALTSFEDRAESLRDLIATAPGDVVLTPHDGEFARLFKSKDDILRAPSKLDKARAAAVFLGAVIVSKGADTVVAAPDGRAAIGYDLPPTLATAGSGDVLSGFVGGLLAQGVAAFEAACSAVWLHGAAARAFGPGLISEDLPEALPGVFRELGVGVRRNGVGWR
jgi:ADP-dependent NAD(P)H-hydrate dehydratase / NAD(P)H-hydrate epimerase